jgi:hypothetical protein
MILRPFLDDARPLVARTVFDYENSFGWTVCESTLAIDCWLCYALVPARNRRYGLITNSG